MCACTWKTVCPLCLLIVLLFINLKEENKNVMYNNEYYITTIYVIPRPAIAAVEQPPSSNTCCTVLTLTRQQLNCMKLFTNKIIMANIRFMLSNFVVFAIFKRKYIILNRKEKKNSKSQFKS